MGASPLLELSELLQLSELLDELSAAELLRLQDPDEDEADSSSLESSPRRAQPQNRPILSNKSTTRCLLLGLDPAHCRSTAATRVELNMS